MKLRDLLKETMPLTSDPQAAFTEASAHKTNVRPTQSGNKYWALEVPGDAARIERIECFHPWVNKRLTVFDFVQGDEVRIKLKGKHYWLPLAYTKYGLGTFLSRGGTIKDNDSHRFWRLAATTDLGFMLVYGYLLLDDGTVHAYPEGNKENFDYFEGVVQPKPPTVKAQKIVCGKRDALGKPSFAERTGQCKPEKASEKAKGPSATVDKRKAVGEVLVCLSVVGCAENNDFEPSGALKNCRVYPQISLIASVPTQKMRARLTCKRPDVSPMVAVGHHPDHVGSHADMDPKMSAILISDRDQFKNAALTPPLWNYLFDYYLDDARAGEKLRAVRYASKAKDAKYENNAIRESYEVIQKNVGSSTVPVHTTTFDYIMTTVKKQARRGEFDNLHIAPRMKFNGHLVTMAPICQHDCVHTHWRWGSVFTKKPFLGWSNGPNPTPFTEAGAPLVPPNQAVTIALIAGLGFHYDVVIREDSENDIPAKSLQVINHHGSTFALNVDFSSFGDSMQDQGRKIMIGDFPEFYNHLKYIDKKGANERIRLRGGAAGLAQLRQLGAGAGEDQKDPWDM